MVKAAGELFVLRDFGGGTNLEADSTFSGGVDISSGAVHLNTRTVLILKKFVCKRSNFFLAERDPNDWTLARLDAPSRSLHL